MVSAIILAAGLSSRMGRQNKLLLPYKNKTVIAAVVETILNSGIEDIIVVTGHESAQIKDALQYAAVSFILNQRYAEGMTSSIQAGMSIAKGNGFMICLSDMVTITSAEYKHLESSFENRLLLDAEAICLPQYGTKKGNPVIFSASYKEMILNNPQPEGCKNIVQSNSQHHHFIDMETPHVLQDFDYPEDYKKLFPDQLL